MRYSTLLTLCAAIVYITLRFLPADLRDDHLTALIIFNLIPYLIGIAIAAVCSHLAAGHVGRAENLRFSIDYWLIGSAIYLVTICLFAGVASIVDLQRQGWTFATREAEYSEIIAAIAAKCEISLKLGIGIVGSAYGRKSWSR